MKTRKWSSKLSRYLGEQADRTDKRALSVHLGDISQITSGKVRRASHRWMSAS